MDAVLGYAKVTVTIQSYSKARSYDNATGTHYDSKDTRRAWCRSATAATSSTSEEVSELKTNDNGSFMLDGKFYPLKAFVPEEIYLGKLSRVFWDAFREKKMGLSLNLYKKDKN